MHVRNTEIVLRTLRGERSEKSLAVLRPRLKSQPETAGSGSGDNKPRKRLPSWDDVLFGSAPAAARE